MGNLNHNINVTGTNSLNPQFAWQVGLKNSELIGYSPKFRVTVRPLNEDGNSSRIPHPTVLYEETGIIINSIDNLGQWKFPLSANAAITGGPYRDYQVVVEAHDSNGNTSAGNRVGTSSEDGWTAYPDGFDVLAVYNPRQTGIELSNNLPTQLSGTTRYFSAVNNYESRQYLDANGNITIKYNSGVFSEDLVGGFIYTSTIPFPKYDIFNSGDTFYYPRVQKTRFDFNPLTPYINVPGAAFDVRGAPFIYGSVSFFDSLDKIALDNGQDISSQLYVSDNALFYNDSSVGTLSMNGIFTLGSVMTTGYPVTGSARAIQLIGTGSIEIARTSTSGNVNLPGNITSIFYMSRPMTGLNYTGIGGYGVVDTYGGIGGNSISNIDAISYGGFLSGTKVAIGIDGSLQTDQYADISSLAVGSDVIAWYYNYSSPGGSNPDGNVYDYTGDNWRSAANKYPINTVSWATAKVSKFEKINLSSYYRMTFTGTIGKYIYLDVGENQVLTFSNNGYSNIDASLYPTGYFFRRAKDVNEPLTLVTDIPNSYIYSGKQLINQETSLYCINVSPYNTFQVSGSGNPYAGYDTRPTYVHDSVFSVKSIYNY